MKSLETQLCLDTRTGEIKKVNVQAGITVKQYFTSLHILNQSISAYLWPRLFGNRRRHQGTEMTTQRIAELEAEVMRLREALEDSGRLYCTMIGNELMTKPSMFERNVVCKFVRGRFREMRPAIIQKALSTPFTPTALNELIEKVEKRTIERCAKGVFKLPEDIDEYESPIVAANKAIRTLPVGQIKLKELL